MMSLPPISEMVVSAPIRRPPSEVREIPRGQRERRAELRRLYAGIDEDYEDIPEVSTAPIEPIIPNSPAPKKVVKVECSDWPLADAVITGIPTFVSL